MSRKTPWKSLSLLLLIALGLKTACLSREEPGPSARPNIVFLLIDDMGWPDIGCYGHEFHETPNIDRLARDGMKFTDFYAGTPVCSSTRASIQSGQYSARVGITNFIPGHWRPFEKLIVPPIENALPKSIQTPGDALRGAGYTTGYFGKWHLGGRDSAPDRRGYDVTASNLGKEFRDWRQKKAPGPKRIDLLTDQTIYFIEKHKEKPFFVTLSHHAVHIPLEAEQKTIQKYRRKPKPKTGVNNPIYAAMIEDLDRSIGRILATIEKLGLKERTVVVFTSDNGGLRQIYTGIGEVVSTNAPLRDEKGTVYEGGIRVPMIVRWPGVVSAGTVCREPSTCADLLPTFCEVAGAALPGQPIDGSSLAPLWKNSSAKLPREAIYFHYPHYHHSRPAGAIRAGDYKLIEFFDGSPLELYNLRDDLGESKNLAPKQAERAEELHRKLAAWRKRVGARMPTPNPKYDPDRAHEWWNRGTKKPLDLKAMEERYRSRDKK
jgi:uncharacterized sulfatase